MIRSLDEGAGTVLPAGLVGRKNIDDSPIADDNSVISQDEAVRLDRDAPAGQDQGVALLHFVCFVECDQGRGAPSIAPRISGTNRPECLL